jgi:putative ABC transport system permease protein
MFSDLRYAFRTACHHRSFATVAILSIALGVGANAFMFSLADALVLRPLPVPHAARVMNLRSQVRGQVPIEMSYPDFVDFRAKSRAFEGLAAMELNQFGFAPDKQAQPQMKAGLLVSGNFFDALRVPPQLGRGFRPDEDTVPGRDAVTVISHDTWRSEFASSPAVVGRAIFVNGIEFRIVGVAPESFTGVDQYFRPALYIPLMMNARLSGSPAYDWLANRADRRLMVKARLKDGVSTGNASAEARVIAASLGQAYPATNRDWSAAVRTEFQLRTDRSPFDAILVALLLGLAAVVFVIACANVGNLMLGRALARSGEIAIRMAVGASRWRLVRQLLTESLLLSLLGGAGGLLLAQVCRDALLPFRIPSEIPIEIDISLDLRVILYAMGAVLVSTVLCGLVPALRATRSDIEPALRAGGRGLEPRRRFAGRNALVVAQVAGSLFLLVCASQLYKGISSVVTAPATFRSDHLLMAGFNPTMARNNEAQAQAFYRRLTDRAKQLPGAVSASMAELVPLANHTDDRLVAPEGYRFPPGKDSDSVFTNVVSEEYFSTLAIPVIQGRGFRVADTPHSPRVAVVNEHFVRTYYPGGDPIGKRFRLGGQRGDWVEIVGVAKQSKYLLLVEPPVPFLYLPMSQNYKAEMMLLVQTSGPSQSLAPALRNLIHSLDANQPVFAMSTVEEYIHDRATRVFTLLLSMVGGMGLLGLILALSGLYAVMAWSVARRSREIGIRMTMGADTANVLGLVLKQGLRLSAAGIAGGLALSLLLSRALTAGIGIPSFSLPVLLAVTLALLAMTAVAAYVPARRAALLDPLTVLKQD